MTLQVAFLRAVNVGRRAVRMDALREVFADMGWPQAQTFIASGNVIFEHPPGSSPGLEERIAVRLATAFGFEIDTFVRSVDDIAALVATAVFEPVLVERCTTHVVGFLKAPVRPSDQRLAHAWDNGVDRVVLRERELHWLSSARQSDSALSGAVFERTLGQRLTLRGVPTLRRLIASLPAPVGPAKRSGSAPRQRSG